MLVLCAAIVDAYLHDVEGAKGSAKAAIDQFGGEPSLHRLRNRRNSIVHANPAHPALTVDQHYSDREVMEEEAREAITSVFLTLYSSPWI